MRSLGALAPAGAVVLLATLLLHTAPGAQAQFNFGGAPPELPAAVRSDIPYIKVRGAARRRLPEARSPRVDGCSMTRSCCTTRLAGMLHAAPAPPRPRAAAAAPRTPSTRPGFRRPLLPHRSPRARPHAPAGGRAPQCAVCELFVKQAVRETRKMREAVAKTPGKRVRGHCGRAAAVGCMSSGRSGGAAVGAWPLGGVDSVGAAAVAAAASAACSS